MSEDRDLAIGGVPFGRRPGLIVVDMTYGFTSSDSPLGGVFDSEIDAAQTLVSWFHACHFPVFYSTVVYKDDYTQSVFRRHLPDLNILAAHSKWVEVDERLTVLPTDTIIEKTGPSAFFGTPLSEQLIQKKCDSLMVCGLTTSGCVRATVVDALQYNYPTWVVEQACGDRNISAHNANLHDMNAKYASVVSLSDATAFLESSKNK